MRRPIKWTLTKCRQEAKKYKSRTEFSTGSSGAYQAAKKNSWLDNVCSHMQPIIHVYWDYHRVKKEAKKYKIRSDFKVGSPGAYTAAYRNGWIDDVCSHMKQEHRPQNYWDYKTVKKEAKKYKKRYDFLAGSPGAYTAAYRNGWIDGVCSHMQPVIYVHWDYKTVKKEAKKYKTRSEFEAGSRGAYRAAHRNGWTDDVCRHMKCRNQHK